MVAELERTVGEIEALSGCDQRTADMPVERFERDDDGYLGDGSTITRPASS
jgi:hypothetical protein